MFCDNCCELYFFEKTTQHQTQFLKTVDPTLLSFSTFSLKRGANLVVVDLFIVQTMSAQEKPIKDILKKLWDSY